MRKRKRTRQDFYRINWQIRAPTVRLIDDQGKQIGIVSLQEARRVAQEKGLDLVEIAPRANPPVVKVIDYAKFKYEQDKKRREARKKTKQGSKIKEIQLSPFIGEADFKTRVERAKDFAQEGDRLKVVLKFKGRQITKKEFGYQLLERIKQELAELYQQDGEIKLTGKRLVMFMKLRKTATKQDGQKATKEQIQNSKISS